jgi:putative transposase
LLREAFRWSVMRRVTRTASVSVAGNHYSVDPSLIGRRIELRFDPEDLARLDVFWDGRPIGQAVPFVIGRHVHRQVSQAQPPASSPPTGVDYLGLVMTEHDEQLLGQIAYRNLPAPTTRDQRA